MIKFFKTSKKMNYLREWKKLIKLEKFQETNQLTILTEK